MFTICSLYVHCIVHWMCILFFTNPVYSVYSLYVHYMFTTCSLYVHGMVHWTCILFFDSPGMFSVCSLYVHYMFTVCSLYGRVYFCLTHPVFLGQFSESN